VRRGVRGGRGRSGLLVAGLLGSWGRGCGVWPGDWRRVGLVGAGEAIYGVTPTYGAYLLLHFPVFGALKFALIVALIVALFRAAPDGGSPAVDRPGPLSATERRLMLLLATTVTLWATDSLHGVSPAWISLAAGALVLTPGLGLGPLDGFKRIEVGPLIFVAAAVSLGVVAAEMGVGAALAGKASALPLDPEAPALNFLTLAGLTTVASVVLGVAGAPGALAPIAQSLADQAGWSLNAALMIQIIGLSTLIFPYQSPPLVVGAQLAQLRIGAAIRFCVLLAAATILTLWPLGYLWWRMLGVI